MAESVFRIHPAIGIARVGNSPEYYLGPETIAGLPTDDPHTVGGLPIRPGTESEPITSDDLRDRFGAMKRQAARFKIFHYDADAARRYPSGTETEVTIGSEVEGKRVRDIVWTVHLANKKANAYYLNDELGVGVYERAHADALQPRNAAEGPDLNNAARLRRLVIDPGPRAIRGTTTDAVHFDRRTTPTYADGADIVSVPSYPMSFPEDSFATLYEPTGKIDTLGELATDKSGRLLVIGGPGRACAWTQADGTPFPLIGDLIAPGIYGDVNSNGWYDDIGDGPVSATLVFDNGTTAEVHGAWVVTSDPGYAPQSLNVVSLWDDIFDTWVRKMNLLPALCGSTFVPDYRPSFIDEIFPIFRAVMLQRWTTNLPERAITAHDAVGRIGPHDEPASTIMTGLAYVRDPENPQASGVGAPFMPLSMGDAGKAFLSVTPTQYFLMSRWDQGAFDPERPIERGPGEQLDRAVLANCLGGRFAPGIEMTFIVREPDIYQRDWIKTGAGPFRLRGRDLQYESAHPQRPFLSIGYIPRHPGPDGIRPAPLEPGDVTKFMAIPWHTDYNSCATHNATPNPTLSSTLYWSWPAQRPVAVHRAEDVHDGRLGPQKWSVRGAGTADDGLEQAGRYQELIDSVINWHRIGIVLQGCAIAGETSYPADQFLEVSSQLDTVEVPPWPINAKSLGT